MQVIYICSGCSPQKYYEYVESRGQRAQQQSQKYNRLLMEGMVANGVQVTTISTRPINRSLTKQVFFKGESDCANGVRYHYVPFLNLPVLRNISVLISVFWKVLFWKKQPDTVLVCDSLNIAAAAGAIPAAKLRQIKTVGIVTDLPCRWFDDQMITLNEKINLALMKKFNSYLLLTEQMSTIVNPKSRPYVVLEGHADVAMANRENRLEDKHSQRVCLFAGALCRVYGVENLVEGFIQANISNTELHIYGNGDYVEELKKLSEKYENVKYLGIAPNETIVREELKATLLVNPRPTNEDYTKYSFPSKNMEYMASGTPVLTTCLPGMPKEYNDYVFLLQDETTEGVKKALQEIFTMTDLELHEKGETAKAFVLNQKNNVVQARKVLEMIEKGV